MISATSRFARAYLLDVPSTARTLLARVTIVLSLVLFLYAPTLGALVKQWWTDPNFGHGFFIPLFSGHLLWRSQEVWRHKPINPSNWGLLIMIWAITLLVVGSLGAELFISRISLLVLISGIILFLAGWGVLEAVSFPLGYLFFMIPIPTIVYNQIAFPLQLLASRLATFCLEFAHVPVLRYGNLLSFSNYSLDIVEACSGIRSLTTLIAFVVGYAHLFEPRRWARCLLILLTFPIALASNAIRIVGTAVMARQFGPAAAKGFLHGFSSWAIFTASLILMCSLHWLLRRIGGAREAVARG